MRHIGIRWYRWIQLMLLILNCHSGYISLVLVILEITSIIYHHFHEMLFLLVIKLWKYNFLNIRCLLFLDILLLIEEEFILKLIVRYSWTMSLLGHNELVLAHLHHTRCSILTQAWLFVLTMNWWIHWLSVTKEGLICRLRSELFHCVLICNLFKCVFIFNFMFKSYSN